MTIKVSLDGKAWLYYKLLGLTGLDREGRIAVESIRSAMTLSEDEVKAIHLEEVKSADDELIGAGWQRRCTQAQELKEVSLERDCVKRLISIIESWTGISQIDHKYFAEALYRDLKSAL